MDETERALDAGAISCTTNPTYCAKLLKSEPDFVRGIIDAVLRGRAVGDSAADRAVHPDDDAVAGRVVQADDVAADQIVQKATARLLARFLPLYEQTGGRQGFVTIQSDPRKDEDARELVDSALRYRVLGPNFMAKIPVTAAGLEAIETLVAENVPLCATEIFAIDQAVAVCERYQHAAEKTGSRPPLYVTHITGIFDEYLGKRVASEAVAISAASLPWAGSTVARKEYRLIQERRYPGTMLGGGARSTRHFTDFVGGDFHITINWSTAQELIEWDPPVVSRIAVEPPPEVLAELSSRLPDFRRAYEEGSLPVEEFADFGPVQLFRNNFIAGYETLLAKIAARRRVVT